MITHATIIPLIGGETLGQEKAFGSRPDYLLSYEPFWSNDQHIVNYYNNEVPYYVLDKGDTAPHKVDVIGTVCPCAGLSQLSHGFGDDNPNNKWLPETTKYVLEELQPKVFWGENAPGFAGKIGANIRKQLLEIGKANGYTMSVYRTQTILHGGPQTRNRSFYFFWKGKRAPIFDWFKEPHVKIEDVILGVKSNSQREPINHRKPSTDPYYRYILEGIHGGISHSEFFKKMDAMPVRENDTQSYIEKSGISYETVGKWMAEQGLEREVAKCKYKHEKLLAGGNIMRRGTVIPKDHIGAFVGHYPTCLAHPNEDRYIDYREAMTIMGLPEDFELIDAKKNFNHICQNVPVKTAYDMACQIKKYLEGKLEVVETDYILQNNVSETIEMTNKKVQNIEHFFEKVVYN